MVTVSGIFDAERVAVVSATEREGIENVVVITAGFGETGSEGAKREAELQALAAEYDLNVVGPNSLGVISTPSGLNATFAPGNARPGRTSFMSQSGALVTAILERAGDREIGFKDIVSLGNKAVLDETDFVETWGADPDTDVVLGYLEGIEDVIHTGRTRDGETVARMGALLSDYADIDAMLPSENED